MTEGNAWTNQSGFLPLKNKLEHNKENYLLPNSQNS